MEKANLVHDFEAWKGILNHQHELKNVCIKTYSFGGCILGHRHEDKQLLNLICGVRKARNWA